MSIVTLGPSPRTSHGIVGSQPPLVQAVPINSRSPDTWLIRLCAEWIAVEAAQEAIWLPFYDVVGGEPSPEEQARSEALSDRKWRIEDMIIRTSARTAEGREAKARVLLMMVGASSSHDDPHEAMARSLALDVLPVKVATDQAGRRGGVSAPDE